MEIVSMTIQKKRNHANILSIHHVEKYIYIKNKEFNVPIIIKY